jgi:phage N-6-adenine-methyltransferase
MSRFDGNRFASASQEWATPDELFAPLEAEFHFTLDVCADASNTRASHWLGESDNGLICDWGENTCWMNPPYRQVGKWIKKAYEASRTGATVVCLVPARTNTVWWHDYCMRGEVRFVRGRPKFAGARHGLPQPLAVIVFRPPTQRASVAVAALKEGEPR